MEKITQRYEEIPLEKKLEVLRESEEAILTEFTNPEKMSELISKGLDLERIIDYSHSENIKLLSEGAAKYGENKIKTISDLAGYHLAEIHKTTPFNLVTINEILNYYNAIGKEDSPALLSERVHALGTTKDGIRSYNSYNLAVMDMGRFGNEVMVIDVPYVSINGELILEGEDDFGTEPLSNKNSTLADNLIFHTKVPFTGKSTFSTTGLFQALQISKCITHVFEYGGNIGLKTISILLLPRNIVVGQDHLKNVPTLLHISKASEEYLPSRSKIDALRLKTIISIDNPILARLTSAFDAISRSDRKVEINGKFTSYSSSIQTVNRKTMFESISQIIDNYK
jgi:hypothetical protein